MSDRKDSETIAQLVALLIETQHLTFALHAYLQEQPGFNAKRFADLYRHERERPAIDPALPLADQLRARMQLDELRDFEGEPQ